MKLSFNTHNLKIVDIHFYYFCVVVIFSLVGLVLTITGTE